MVGRNLTGPAGECDILAAGPGGRVVVEVKTIRRGDPFARVDEEKVRHLSGLARSLGASRIDVVGVVLGADAVTIHAVHGW